MDLIDVEFEILILFYKGELFDVGFIVIVLFVGCFVSWW